MNDDRPDILPQEQVKPTRFASFALLLVITIILVIGANFFAFFALRWIPVNRGNALVYEKWMLMDRALSAKKSCDILIVGDSSSNQGLDPRVIREETGKSAINLGVVAEALTLEPVWTVDRFFQQSKSFGKPPKTILWMHVYDIWSREDPHEKRLGAISAHLPHTAWPYIERGPPVSFDTRELWLMKLMPLYYQNTSLSRLVRLPVKSARFSHRFRFDEAGFTAETISDPDVITDDTRRHMAMVRETPEFSMTILSKRSIDTMRRIADKYGAEVWIVQSPLNRSIWEDPVFRKRWYEVRDSLRAATAKDPNMRVMFDEPVLFDDAQMQNCDHLLVDSARAFTKIVIDRIESKPAAKKSIEHRK